MPPASFDPARWLVFMMVARAGTLAFERLTGMTLDEWDEMNHRRVMSHAGG